MDEEEWVPPDWVRDMNRRGGTLPDMDLLRFLFDLTPPGDAFAAAQGARNLARGESKAGILGLLGAVPIGGDLFKALRARRRAARLARARAADVPMPAIDPADLDRAREGRRALDAELADEMHRGRELAALIREANSHPSFAARMEAAEAMPFNEYVQMVAGERRRMEKAREATQKGIGGLGFVGAAQETAERAARSGRDMQLSDVPGYLADQAPYRQPAQGVIDTMARLRMDDLLDESPNFFPEISPLHFGSRREWPFGGPGGR